MISSLRINIDGACKGNPGPSGIGITIRNSDGVFIEDISKNIGIKTCNQAEYYALIIALEYCIDEGYINISIKIESDSKLVVNQMNGKFKVNNDNIVPLYLHAKGLINEDCIKIYHIKREYNSEADTLANAGVYCGDTYEL